MIKLIKRLMAKIDVRRVVPTPDEVAQGAQPMTKSEIVDVLAAYKKQNPAKYEAKKAELFKRYGLTDAEEKVEVPDEGDKELAEIKTKVAKK